MKNREVVDDFINGIESKGSNLYSEDNVIYSYGKHFPLGIRFDDGCFAINSDGYSNTTARHKGLLKRAVSGCEIVWLDTQDMQKVIDLDIRTKSELLIKMRL